MTFARAHHQSRLFRSLLISTLVLGLGAGTSLAAPFSTPGYLQLSLQGQLSDGGLPVTTSTNVTIRLYDAPTVGVLVYSEPQTLIPDENGVFETRVGNTGALYSKDFAKSMWAEIQIDGQPDPLLPRIALRAAPSAHFAHQAFMPHHRVAFHARQTASQTGIDSGVQTPILFQTDTISPAFDLTGNFNTTTGAFTAPVDGVYFFEAGVTIQTSAGFIIKFLVNDGVVDQATCGGPVTSSLLLTGRNSTHLDLVAGNTVKVAIEHYEGAVRSTVIDRTSFSGHLVFPTGTPPGDS